MMRDILVVLLSLVIWCFALGAHAQVTQIQDLIAHEIAKQTQLDRVVIKTDHKVALQNTEGMDLLSVLVGRDHKFTAMLNSSGGESTIHGRYYEAVVVPVLQESIACGEILHKDLIKMVPVPSFQARNHVSNANQLIGMVAKRKITANHIIKVSDVGAAPIIQKGDNVAIRLKNNNLLIEAEGTSVEPGALGQRIRVRNLSSNKTIIGTVVEHGIVEVKIN